MMMMIMYQILAKSRNPRRSYCDFSIWPNDLEHVSHVALCFRTWSLNLVWQWPWHWSAWPETIRCRVEVVKVCTES